MSEITKVYSFDALVGEMAHVIKGISENNAKAVLNEVNRFPMRVQTRARGFFTKVLHVRSNNLRGHIVGFSRSRISDKVWEMGLRVEDVAYAAIQEFGGRTKAHVIKARLKPLLGFYSTFFGHVITPRQVNHPGSRIPAHHYLKIPLVQEAWVLADKLKKAVGFGKSG